MERYWPALVGDFAHYFPGTFLEDFCDQPGGGDSRLTYRRAAELIEWLPGESATKTAMREAMTDAQREALRERVQSATGHGRWSAQMFLLAEIADQIQWMRHAFYASNSKDGRTSFKPTPIPRPGVEPPAEKTQFGTVKAVITEDRIANLRKLRANRGLPDGG